MRLRLPRELLAAPPARLDWLLFAVLSAACYVVFQQGDISITAAHALAYLQGHFLDFYEYNARVVNLPGYLPSTYIVFALWNIPLWLLGLVGEGITASQRLIPLMWDKLLPTLFYLAVGFVTYKISHHLGFGHKRSKVIAYVWLTTPIAFFSQFIFGQYDSIGLFLVLVGLFFYFKGDLSAFALLCGAAFTFKYFHLLIFVPLLLLREKGIARIMSGMALFALPWLIVMLPYIPSQAFRQGVFGFQPASFVLGPSIWNGYVYLRLVVLGWIVTCAWAYSLEPPTERDLANWAFFFINLTMFLMFGLSLFNPQWLILATPFWVISSFMNTRVGVFLLLDILMMLFFIAFAASFHGLGQDLFALGVLKGLAVPVMAKTTPMKDLLLAPDASISYSVFSALMLVQAIFKHPRYCANRPARSAPPTPELIRTRFVGGIAIFVLPAAASLILGLISPSPFFSTVDRGLSTVGPLTAGQEVQQAFVAKTAVISKLKFLPGLYAGKDAAQLRVQLVDPVANKTLWETETNGRGLVDHQLYTLRPPLVRVRLGQQYLIVFHAENVDDEHQLTIYRTEESDPAASQYAIINGQRQLYDLALNIYGY